MPTLTIDGQSIDVKPGTTILEAARRLGIDIPTLCFLPGYHPPTACMVCVVKVQGVARLLPSCATLCGDGMVIESESDDVRSARKCALELLMSDHLGDCVGPCQSVCPANMNIPLMIRHIAAGRYREALITVKERIAIPAILGRICPEVCENGCRRKQQDASLAICELKRFVADTDLTSKNPYLPATKAPSGKRVAIVGAGPAGIAAAYYLQLEGHACTILDAGEQPGGKLRYAIPREKLPARVLDAEIETVVKLGASIRSNVRVGEHTSLDELRAEYDAVLLAAGELDADGAKRLGLPLVGKGIKTEKRTGQTGLPNVFAAGGCVAPTKHAVRAQADGRSAAMSISQFLAGAAIAGGGREWTCHIGKLEECEVPRFMEDGVNVEGRLDTTGGFDAEEAQREARRCMHCDCLKIDTCDLRKWCDAYDAGTATYRGERRKFERDLGHATIVHEPGKCIACGRCVLVTEKANEPLGMAYKGRGFTTRIVVPFGGTLAEGLTDAAKAAAEHCPTASLALKEE
jgi:NADPH-dependent glutamate synthase beta subunit-like oxidoreductase